MRLLLWLVLCRGGNLGRRRPGEPVPAGGEARGRASAEHGQRQHAVAAALYAFLSSGMTCGLLIPPNRAAGA